MRFFALIEPSGYANTLLIALSNKAFKATNIDLFQ
jgi:hypothetical protein